MGFGVRTWLYKFTIIFIEFRCGACLHEYQVKICDYNIDAKMKTSTRGGRFFVYLPFWFLHEHMQGNFFLKITSCLKEKKIFHTVSVLLKKNIRQKTRKEFQIIFGVEIGAYYLFFTL